MKKYLLLVIFLLLFFIPEILWSPVITMFFNFFITGYVFRQTDFIGFTPNVISAVLFVEFIGLVGSLIILRNLLQVLNSKIKLINFIFGILLIVLSAMSLFSFLISILFRSIGF